MIRQANPYLLMPLLFCLEPNRPCNMIKGAWRGWGFRGLCRLYARLSWRLKDLQLQHLGAPDWRHIGSIDPNESLQRLANKTSRRINQQIVQNMKDFHGLQAILRTYYGHRARYPYFCQELNFGSAPSKNNENLKYDMLVLYVNIILYNSILNGLRVLS